MRRILLGLMLFVAVYRLPAQSVGIGTATPDSSAILEINSSNKGLLLPRVKDTLAIKNPVKGLFIYNNNDNMPWYYDGMQWQKTIPDVVMADQFIGKDSLWYKVQDSIASTYYPYVHINANPGLIKPQANLQAAGNFLVQPKLTYSVSPPAVTQTYTMNNTTVTQQIPVADSVFRIYDPGGTADYNNNMQGNISTSPFVPKGAGVKISSVAADFGIGSGDTLWIAYSGFPECRTRYAYFFTNTTINPEDFTVSGDDIIYFIFRSNADGVVGKGFNFSVTRLYSLEKYKKISTAGPALYFNSINGAFGAGLAANANGKGSFVTGSNTIANGWYATAMGYYSTAAGNYSIAIGYNTTAAGSSSIAIGQNSTAGSNNSTAIGISANASGHSSMAMGRSTTASGNNSTAMGNWVSTNNYEGSFVIGDNSTTALMYSANANNFRARFAGGYKLFTSANLSTGCTLFAGDNAWTTGSDVRTKENFAAVSGEEFLKKIAGFHLTSWNYKTQDPKTFRHYGPMAQDFFAAFGKDKFGTIGNDTTINSADFAGVSFIAIQALEKRTQKISQLEKENEELKQMLLAFRKEMDELKKENAAVREQLQKSPCR